MTGLESRLGFTPAFSALRVANLKDVAVNQSNTLLARFFEIHLDAINDDLDAAGQKLAALMERYEAEAEGNDFLCTNLFQAHLILGQPDVGAELVNRRLKKPGWIKVEFAEGKLNPSTVRWTAQDAGHSIFGFSRQLYDYPQNDMWLNNWYYFLRLCQAYSASSKFRPGAVLVGLDDAGVAPGLAFCGASPSFFLVPDPIFVGSRSYTRPREAFATCDIPWTERLPLAFWRGSTTGRYTNPSSWQDLPRIRLSQLALERPDIFDVGLTRVVQIADPAAPEILKNRGLMRPFFPDTEFNKYKYQIDIDGNTNAWGGLFTRLLTGSPVIKVRSPFGFEQWYYDRLRPWIEIVPVESDMSDLAEKVDWLRAHDDVGRKIGQAGRQLAERMTLEGEAADSADVIAAAFAHFSGVPEFELRFGVGEDGNSCLRDGWAEPEQGGVLSLGKEARIELPCPKTRTELLLCLELAPVTTVPQRIGVVVNGSPVLSAPVRPGEQRAPWLPSGPVISWERVRARERFTVRLPAGLARGSSVMAITLLLSDAARLASMEHPLDGREASIVLHRLTLGDAQQ